MRPRGAGRTHRAACAVGVLLAALAALLLSPSAVPGTATAAVHAAAAHPAHLDSHRDVRPDHRCDADDAWHDTRAVPPRACRPARLDRPALSTDTPPAPPCVRPPHPCPDPAALPADGPAVSARHAAPDAGRAPPPPGS